MNVIHTCSYSCDRPACIRAQRDDLAARLATNATDPVRAILAQLRHEVDQDKGGYYTNYERGRLEEKRRSIQLLEAALAQQPEAPAQDAAEKEREQDAWNDFESEFLTDGNGYAPAATYGACAAAWGAAWPDAKAAYAAAKAEYQRLHPPCRAPQPAIPEGWSFVQQDDGSIVARAEGYGAACVREGDNTSVAAGLLYLLAADLLAARPTQESDHG